MGKHTGKGTSTSSGYTGKHRAGDSADSTVPIRVDRDPSGKATGFGIGKLNTDNPGGYDSTR